MSSQTTTPTRTIDEQARTGYAAGLFAARYLSEQDGACACPKCWRPMHVRDFGKAEDGGTLWGFACNSCRTLMMAEADDELDAAEALGVLA